MTYIIVDESQVEDSRGYASCPAVMEISLNGQIVMSYLGSDFTVLTSDEVPDAAILAIGNIVSGAAFHIPAEPNNLRLFAASLMRAADFLDKGS